MRRPTRLLLPLILGVSVALSGCADDSDTAPVGDSGSAATVVPETSVVPEPTAGPETTIPPETTVERTYDFSIVSDVAKRFVANSGLDGAGLIVVQRDDGVIHHEHWGAFDENRISLVASSSKMVTAGVLMRLDDDGLLDVDAPVADVVDWGSGNPDITPAQLVSNSSGLVGLLQNPAYGPYLCQFDVDAVLQSCAETIFTTPDDDGDVAPPDSEFRYGGAQWQVAGAVAEVASGKSWAELIDEIYVEPCGLDALAYNNPFAQEGSVGLTYPADLEGNPATLQPTDNPSMEGGAYVTTGDYGALLLMHLRDGKCGETQVLSPAAIERLHTDRISSAYGGSAGGAGYGMGWWVDRERGRISDAGAYGSVPWLDLDDGYGAFLVIEADSVTGARFADELYEPVEAAVTGR